MENTKILVVDDDQDIRDSLQAILQSQQYSVSTAENRTVGMEKIEAEQPDLIILDVMMEKYEDGFEMARELKHSDQYKDIPILMLTGVKKETGIDFKSAAGDPNWFPVDGFLDKPIKPDILLAEIEKIIPKKD